LGIRPANPPVTVLEMPGGSSKQQQRQPLPLGVSGRVIEPFPYRFRALEIMMLIEQSVALFEFA
jgi:hypothetical protein